MEREGILVPLGILRGFGATSLVRIYALKVRVYFTWIKDCAYRYEFRFFLPVILSTVDHHCLDPVS